MSAKSRKIDSKADLTSAYVKSLDAEHKKRYFEKLEISVGKDKFKIADPYGGSLQYVNDPNLWPSSFSYGELYSYLIDSPGIFNKENMKAVKSLAAHQYFESNFVKSILYAEVSKESPVCILRTRVVHSQRMSEKPVEVWAAINKEDGSVHCAHCQCMAGLGEVCSHVGALLFKLEAFNRIYRNQLSCTDELCQWNKVSIDEKNLEHIPIKEMTFKKSKYGKSNTSSEHHPVVQSAKPLKLDEIDFNSLKNKNPNASVFTLLEKLDSDDTDTASEDEAHRNIELSGVKIKPIFDIQEHLLTKDLILSSIAVTASESHEIDLLTRGQSTNLTWYDFRFGRITSSVIYDVFQVAIGKSKQNIDNLCQKMMKLNPILNSKQIPLPMKWGRDHEKDAIISLKQVLMKESHQNLSFDFPGIIINSTDSYLASSPDAVVTCDCCGTRPVECKCPFSSVSEIPIQNCDPNKIENLKKIPYLKANNQGVIEIKKNHKHYFQLICHMGTLNDNNIDCSKGYFVVWTCEGENIQTVSFDKGLWEDIKSNCKTFFLDVLQSKILKHVHKDSSSCNVLTYLCSVCKKVYSDSSKGTPSIQCNLCQKWYHLPCVGVGKSDDVVINETIVWLCSTCDIDFINHKW